MNTLAPIVLFVYNRPRHTRKTVEALLNNRLSDQSKLFIYSDSEKSSKDLRNVQEVRDYIHSISGFKEIKIIERQENWGLADSIIDGVTKVVNKYGRVIVLEDDLVTSRYFLKFMNDALEYYKSEDRVMHISGWNYPLKNTGYEETVFLRGSSCWGWGTWVSSWRFFEKNTEKLIAGFSQDDKYRFDYDGSAGMWSQVELNRRKKIDTWAIFWYASVFKNDGLCLHPVKTLTRNIGHDGTGEHCGYSSLYDYQVSEKEVVEFSNSIVESKSAMLEINGFFRKNKNNLLLKLLNLLRKYKKSFVSEH